MTWIDKELRKRERLDARVSAKGDSQWVEDSTTLGSAKLLALWQKLESANEALPEKLRLKREVSTANAFPSERSAFLMFLVAKNGSGIGYTGDAIRYIWPQRNARSSYNFWIRWHPALGYRLIRRVRPSMFSSGIDEHAFNEAALDHIFKCLVVEARVKYWAVRKRRFWLF